MLYLNNEMNTVETGVKSEFRQLFSVKRIE